VGMDQKIVFSRDKAMAWPALVERMAMKDVPIDLRMIDGQLAFPDESPPDTWRELRIGTTAGMITLRREDDGVTLVIWGNADEKLRAATNELAKAIAELTGGVPVGA
jgi:hypothetical protein